MPKQNNAPAVVRVIEDVPQQSIIQNRRRLREQLLKQIGQRTSVTEHKIEQLAQLT
ncbi:hypothetical protein [Paenibacillus herberti]|uniref:hypothetical protein n=1 Tax=Paenibacillus herberti TaxID=1619309 RepID=UPI0015959F29|nr:hypothetical protein [Paenibacillus herberti]